MKTSPRHSASRWTFLLGSRVGLFLLVGLSLTRAEDRPAGELTVVSATVHNGYQREKLPDGSFKPVTYAFGEGTFDPGSIADFSLSRVKFGQLSTLLSAPLARLGFQPGHDAKSIDQLIVVHWGRTTGWDDAGYGDAHGTLNQASAAMSATFPNGGAGGSFGAPGSGPATRGAGGVPGAADEMDYLLLKIQQQEDNRARANAQNAILLGYYDTLRHIPTHWGNLVSPRREQLLGELEDDRYYVVVAAYDFRSSMESRQRKLLWMTRFSLRARGNAFDHSIDRMILAASSHFGRSSDGLYREGEPDGQAVLGKFEVIDFQESKK